MFTTTSEFGAPGQEKNSKIVGNEGEKGRRGRQQQLDFIVSSKKNRRCENMDGSGMDGGLDDRWMTDRMVVYSRQAYRNSAMVGR
jgi:hypothetical protein